MISRIKLQRSVLRLGVSVAALTVSTNLFAVAPSTPTACDNIVCLYKSSLLHDPEYLQAGAELQSKLQALPIARSSFYPSFTSSDTVKGNYPDGTQPGFSIDVHQLLFNWSTLKHIDQAKLVEQEAYVGLQVARQQLMRRVLLSYIDVLEAQALLQISTKQAQEVRAQLGQQRELQKAEIESRIKTNMLEANLKFFESAVQETKFQLEQKRHQLRLYTGVTFSLPQGEVFSGLPDGKGTTDVKGWAHQVAAQNLEVRSAALEAQIAEKKISMVQGQYVPTVSLSGSYYPKRYYENSQYDHFMYGFDVSFNNLNVGSTQAEVTRSQAEYKKAELKQHQVYSEMINAAAVSAKGLQTLRKQLSALNEAVSLEQQTLTDLDELLKDGNSTLIEVIDQRNKLFSAQEKRIQSFAHFYKLKTELYLAAGWLVPKKLNELKKQFEVVSLGKR